MNFNDDYQNGMKIHPTEARPVWHNSSEACQTDSWINGWLDRWTCHSQTDGQI